MGRMKGSVNKNSDKAAEATLPGVTAGGATPESIAELDRKTESDRVLLVLGMYRVVPGKRKRIELIGECQNTRTNKTKLGKIEDSYCDLIEPERGAARKPLVGIRGKIQKWDSVPGKRRHCTVRIEFDNTRSIREALDQIHECEPPTVFIVQTDQTLPAVNPEDAD